MSTIKNAVDTFAASYTSGADATKDQAAVSAAGFMKTLEFARPTRSSHCGPLSGLGESIVTEIIGPIL